MGYTSGFSGPAASHLAAPPSPRHERQCRTGSSRSYQRHSGDEAVQSQVTPARVTIIYGFAESNPRSLPLMNTGGSLDKRSAPLLFLKFFNL